jgi:poly(3-hydroxybutyrate) depolymerase
LQHTGFVAMNPSNHAKSHWDYFKDLVKGDGRSVDAHRKFYDEYNAVLDMDAEYYLQTIQTVFQDFKLVNGTWDVVSPEGKTERVRPQDISGCALLTVEGELDDISGSGQTRAAHDLCTAIAPSEQQHYEVKGAGHYGIFSGRRWREDVYPVVHEFILKAHQKAAAKPAAKAAAKAAPKSAGKAVAKAPVKTPKKASKQPLAVVKSARSAIKNVAPKTRRAQA